MPSAPDDWTVVLAVGDLAEGKPTQVALGDVALMLYREDDRVFAIEDKCTHQGAPLHKGRVRSFGEILAVTCPAHGSMFRLDTGVVMRGPATRPEPAYETRTTAESIEVRHRIA